MFTKLFANVSSGTKEFGLKCHIIFQDGQVTKIWINLQSLEDASKKFGPKLFIDWKAKVNLIELEKYSMLLWHVSKQITWVSDNRFINPMSMWFVQFPFQNHFSIISTGVLLIIDIVIVIVHFYQMQKCKLFVFHPLTFAAQMMMCFVSL